jgi:hypothetical protein
MENNDTYVVEYHEDCPTKFPRGYWVASTDDGYEGVGATEADAMGNLINILVRTVNVLRLA